MNAEWSIKQQECARLLAIGMSQTAAAKRLDVDDRQVRRWVAAPGYRDYVQALHSEAWEKVEPAIQNLLLRAIAVEQQFYDGEIDAGSPHFKAAQRRIDQYFKIFGTATATAEGGDASAAVQVNNYTSPDVPRIPERTRHPGRQPA